MQPDSYLNQYVSTIYSGIAALFAADSGFQFTAAEAFYLCRWWDDFATPEERAAMRQAASDGRFAFWGGGWTQADMGTTNLRALAYNLEAGHAGIARRLGVQFAQTFQTAASLDPFGISPAYGRMLLAAGAQAWVFTRLPPFAVESLKSQQAAEFLWSPASSSVLAQTQEAKAQGSVGDRRELMAEVLAWYYCTPSWASWEFKPPPNGSELADAVKAAVQDSAMRSAAYRSDVFMAPFGCDFAWQDAVNAWGSLKQVLAAINQDTNQTGLTASIATFNSFLQQRISAGPSIATLPVLEAYRNGTQFGSLAAPHTSELTQWPSPALMPEVTRNVTSVDSPGDVYWTGYFTSRPVWKEATRVSQAAIAAADIASVMAGLGATASSRGAVRGTPAGEQSQADAWAANMTSAREAIAVMTHHDAGTGTFCVVADGCTGGGQTTGSHATGMAYSKYIASAAETSDSVLQAALDSLAGSVPSSSAWSGDPSSAAELLNRGEPVVVRVFNPMAAGMLGQPSRSEIVRIEVPTCHINVTDAASGQPVASQMSSVLSTYTGSQWSYHLDIEIAQIDWLGTRSLVLTPFGSPHTCGNLDTANSPPPARTGAPPSAWAAAAITMDRAQPWHSGSQPEGFPLQSASPGPLRADNQSELLVLVGANVTIGLNLTAPLPTLQGQPMPGLRWVSSPASSSTAMRLEHNLLYYLEQQGDAYAFKPDNGHPAGSMGSREPVSARAEPGVGGAVPLTELVLGPLVREIRYALSHQVRVAVRVFAGDAAAADVGLGGRLEVEVFSGVLPQSTAMVSELVTDIDNNSTSGAGESETPLPMLWTDLNGIEPSRFVWSDKLPRGGNQHPAQSTAWLQGPLASQPGQRLEGCDPNSTSYSVRCPGRVEAAEQPEASGLQQLSVVLSRSHGVSTTSSSGVLELMHARRSVGHAVSSGIVNDDSSRASTTMVISLGDTSSANRQRHEQAQRRLNPLQLAFQPALPHLEPTVEPRSVSGPQAAAGLARGVVLQSIRLVGPDEPFWAAGESGDGQRVRLRLFHAFAMGEDAEFSQPGTVDVSALVTAIVGSPAVTVSECAEVSLTGLWPIQDMPSASWQGGPIEPSNCTGVTMLPLQLRTFDVRVV